MVTEFRKAADKSKKRASPLLSSTDISLAQSPLTSVEFCFKKPICSLLRTGNIIVLFKGGFFQTKKLVLNKQSGY